MFPRLRVASWMVVCVVLASWMCADAQRVIHVPADVPTIQQAIAAAANGDTGSSLPISVFVL